MASPGSLAKLGSYWSPSQHLALPVCLFRTTFRHTHTFSDHNEVIVPVRVKESPTEYPIALVTHIFTFLQPGKIASDREKCGTKL